MNHTVPSRIHPLMAVAAFSLTLVSLVGAASILGLLPNSQARGGVPTEISAAAMPATQIGQPLTAQLQPAQQQQQPQQPQQQFQQQQEQQPRVVEHRTVVHHTYAPARQSNRDDRPTRVVQAPAPVQQAAPQNSAVGIGLGAVVGGLLGNQVGGGRGKTIATVAGALGGAYAGNEIAKRNQQQP
jgi:uncharacterized protein YcfJ